MGSFKSSFKDRFPNFDPNNISGAKLAEIGRWTLTGKKIVDNIDNPQLGYRETPLEGDYTNVGWLDMRVDEICRKGRL